MKRKIRFFFSDFWRLARERRQRQGPALLRVLRNSPRAIPLPGLLHGCLVLIIVVSQNVILSVKTSLLPDKLLISNNLSVKPHLFTDKLSILSQPYSVSVIRAYNRVGGKRSSFLPTFVFRPLTPPYVRFRIRRFFILRAI